jgi:hypothetical protein
MCVAPARARAYARPLLLVLLPTHTHANPRSRQVVSWREHNAAALRHWKRALCRRALASWAAVAADAVARQAASDAALRLWVAHLQRRVFRAWATAAAASAMGTLALTARGFLRWRTFIAQRRAARVKELLAIRARDAFLRRRGFAAFADHARAAVRGRLCDAFYAWRAAAAAVRARELHVLPETFL